MPVISVRLPPACAGPTLQLAATNAELAHTVHQAGELCGRDGVAAVAMGVQTGAGSMATHAGQGLVLGGRVVQDGGAATAHTWPNAQLGR